ncbi:winged helix-turn-helix transcriptional regulator [Crossiella cryophila]|uniref:DNA-binding HxlR family transcriptional regulator n=1 Tax=Crossiella cryophila TaxID=43355 RepID=A0A7W7CMQ7_9PSEU|nr:helix-turn-helix domain-containing protein [Crossiella cryophila]MBB4682279.1 DNA-binding HxlR family transcriptional regulator [Crossiella cryophila]
MVHADSQDPRAAGHQTETHGWDAELVPDERGRTARPEPDCPVEVALAAISGRWTTLVLRELMHGERTFSELRAALPTLSAKILTERLHELTARGLAHREQVNAFPPRVGYRLTAAGLALRPLLICLYETGAALSRSRAGTPAPPR